MSAGYAAGFLGSDLPIPYFGVRGVGRVNHRDGKSDDDRLRDDLDPELLDRDLPVPEGEHREGNDGWKQK